MRTELHERSEIQRELEIHVEEPELQAAFDTAYKAIRPKLDLPGFRKGKAPMSFVKKMHGDAIEGDALEKLAEDKFREAIEELKIEPIGNPVITDIHRHPSEGAHFKVSYEINPTIELQDYSDLEVEHRIVPILDDDVTERIERMRFGFAEREEAQTLEDEHSLAKITMSELDAPEGREPGKSEGVEIYLSDPDILPEIKSALVGKSVGDTVELELPKQQRKKDSSSDGETEEKEERGRVAIAIDGATKITLPELTDELAAKATEGKFTTVEALTNGIREELEAAAAKRSDEEVEENIVAKLLERHKFEVPQTLTRAVLEQMLEERRQENSRRGFPVNYGLDDQTFERTMWPIAEARGKWMLLREQLIKAEALEASDEDLEQLAETESAKYGLSKENLMKYYRKYDTVKNQIVSEKLAKRLREKVKVVEKPVERKARS